MSYVEITYCPTCKRETNWCDGECVQCGPTAQAHTREERRWAALTDPQKIEELRARIERLSQDGRLC